MSEANTDEPSGAAATGADEEPGDEQPAEAPPAEEQPGGQEGGEDEEEHPRGTLLVAAVFFVGLVVIWFGMYFTLIEQS